MKKHPNSIDAHVGKRVRMRRLMLNMSQTDLAGGLGLTFQQVQKYEKGTNRISASRLQQIAHILQVSVPFFFEGSPSSSELPSSPATPFSTYVSEYLSSRDGLKLTKSFMGIKNTMLRSRIVALVEEIASR